MANRPLAKRRGGNFGWDTVMPRFVDLSSDTTTRPSKEMLAAMTAAEVGDEQRNEDPTVNKLQNHVADLLAKEASIFLPSATMANQIAIKVHTNPGDEVIVERSSHVVTSEAGGPAFLSGVMLHAVADDRGMISSGQIEDGIRRIDPHCPRTRLVCVEQTTNRGGGAVWPVERLAAVQHTARTNGLATHMDGSRLMNAVVASGVPAYKQTEGYDSVTFCLSKGLGCPVGALLAGTREFIDDARRYKHLFGGAMRQAGYLAAAGLYALEHNVDRLADDHRQARLLADLLAEIPGITISNAEVETNLVFFNVRCLGVPASKFVDELTRLGIRMGASADPDVVRAVTHLDVTQSDIEHAVHVTSNLAADLRKQLDRETVAEA